MEAILVFLAAVLVGYFLLPVFLKKEALHFFLAHSTNFESAWRDRLFRPLTDRMIFITPNFVTSLGFLLIFVLIYLFLNGASFKIIFWFILAAGFTDMLDGSLARNNNRVTKLGAILDWTRDLLLALVTGYFLWQREFLSPDLILWFFMGWFFLGIIRALEFRVSGGAFFLLEEDYKFALDRIRLFSVWAGVLLLLLMPYNDFLKMAAEILIAISIIISWFSLLFHSAHLRILKEERMGPVIHE